MVRVGPVGGGATTTRLFMISAPAGGRCTPRTTVLGRAGSGAGVGATFSSFRLVTDSLATLVSGEVERALEVLVLVLPLDTDEPELVPESVRPCTFQVFFKMRSAGTGAGAGGGDSWRNTGAGEGDPANIRTDRLRSRLVNVPLLLDVDDRATWNTLGGVSMIGLDAGGCGWSIMLEWAAVTSSKG